MAMRDTLGDRRGLVVPIAVAFGTLLFAAVVWIVIDRSESAGQAREEPASSASATPSASPSPSPSPSQSASPSPSPSGGGSAPAPTSVEWAGPVAAAVKNGFPAMVPAEVPAGWAVTDSRYVKGGQPSWHLTFATATGDEVVLTQEEGTLAEVVAQRLGADARRDGAVDLSRWGTGSWPSFATATGAGLVKQLPDTIAVVSAPSVDVATELAQQLLTAEQGDVETAG